VLKESQGWQESPSEEADFLDFQIDLSRAGRGARTQGARAFGDPDDDAPAGPDSDEGGEG
jgi:hypothetical protein